MSHELCIVARVIANVLSARVCVCVCVGVHLVDDELVCEDQAVERSHYCASAVFTLAGISCQGSLAVHRESDLPQYVARWKTDG